MRHDGYVAVSRGDWSAMQSSLTMQKYSKSSIELLKGLNIGTKNGLQEPHKKFSSTSRCLRHLCFRTCTLQFLLPPSHIAPSHPSIHPSNQPLLLQTTPHQRSLPWSPATNLPSVFQALVSLRSVFFHISYVSAPFGKTQHRRLASISVERWDGWLFLQFWRKQNTR